MQARHGHNEENAEIVFLSATRVFHVYRRVWVPHLVQRLCREREHGNTEDKFTVAVVQHRPRSDEDSDARTTVGHLPRELRQVLLAPSRRD